MALDVGAYDSDALSWFADRGYNISSGLLTAVPYAGFDLAERTMVGSAPTRTLTEGDVIDLGDRAFEVLHLPGHSPGSIGLWEEKSGDYLATMARLADLPVNVVHAGHDPSMSRERFRAVISNYVTSRSSGR